MSSSIVDSSLLCGRDCPCGAFFSLRRTGDGDEAEPQPPCRLPRVALAHTPNSSGRMGSFVNWSTCSCAGCGQYRAQTLEIPETAVTFSNTAPVATFPEGLYLPQRSNGGGIGLLMANPGTSVSQATASDLPEVSWAGIVPLGRSPAGPPVDPEKEALCDSLRSYRAELQMRQDAVYAGPHRSHDEMAAADAEWDELDSQISAIETLLTTLGSFYRTR